MPDPAIPAEHTGGWQRITIAVGDGEPYEDSTVWWLQAPSRHADLRTPLADGNGAEPMCFAGTTSWEDPSLTWAPALELTPSAFVDIGAISWDGDDMLEAGEFAGDDGAVGYVERWRRLPDSEGPLLALEREGGRIVRAGRYALTVLDDRPQGDFVGVAWELDGGRWVEQRRWPPTVAGAAPPPPLALPAGITVVLEDARVWVVVEVRS